MALAARRRQNSPARGPRYVAQASSGGVPPPGTGQTPISKHALNGSIESIEMGTMGTVRTGFFFTSGAGQPYSCAGLVGKVFSMRTALLLLLLAPNLHALDITTLDGKTYRDCRVGQTFPDSICILFSGGGARVK